jgi:hypothetical protein
MTEGQSKILTEINLFRALNENGTLLLTSVL